MRNMLTMLASDLIDYDIDCVFRKHFALTIAENCISFTSSKRDINSNTETSSFGEVFFEIACPEYLIIARLIASCEPDLLDVKVFLQHHPNINTKLDPHGEPAL